MRYTKRRITIEAVQFDGSDASWEEISKLAVCGDDDDGGRVRLLDSIRPACVVVDTPEGLMTAQVGDWVIRGIKGELYPCKPDIFAESYDLAEVEPETAYANLAPIAWTLPEIGHHHDGHGLNESIRVERDMPDHDKGGTAPHRFVFLRRHDALELGHLQFQQGPRHLETSTPGVTDGAVLAAVLERYLGFQRSRYACPENELVIDHLRAILDAIKRRADERAARGVLGTLKQ